MILFVLFSLLCDEYGESEAKSGAVSGDSRQCSQ